MNCSGYVAPTFSSNPIAMAADVAMLSYLKEHRDEVYPHLDEQSERLAGVDEDEAVFDEQPAAIA